MNRTRKTFLLPGILLCAVLAGTAVTGTAADTTILTNLGNIADGVISGLAPVIQLRSPDEVTVIGPMQQYDIPLSSIRQISVDFPRLVIETLTGVVIGPYSAFRGIDEELTLSVGGKSVKIPITALRALALGGRSLQPVPREWMGDHFLSAPEILAAAPLIIDAACDDCDMTIPVTSSGDETPIWNTITPDVVMDDEPAAFPWWLGLLGAAALVALFFLLRTGQSST